ncbi:MAG TPA: lysylphosphatidylglycerol synthase domain-containing protein [Gaiellaceae bacterium]|nr:lysylphosphatidylglycerol synthase domain-containing protein [Gaiellaceae bacterium]
MRWLSLHHLDRNLPELGGLVLLAAALFLASAAGMSYVAGFHAVWDLLRHPVWWWLPVSVAAVAASFVGYYFAYRGIGKVEGGPDDLSTPDRLAVVTAGFGGFLAHGGQKLDLFALRAAGASEREAHVRVVLIAGLEHGLLTVPGTAAAIAALAQGLKRPPKDFTIPWAVGPAIGFAIAFWAASRYRDRLRDRDGWRGKTGVLLDAIHLIGVMFRRPLAHAPALLGMVFFWISDMFALWAAMQAFGFRMNGAGVVIAFGTAMIVTRRTGPLGGAGILMCALPPTLWQCGAPWPAAVAGTIAWRFFTLWLPMPLSFAAIPRLRALGGRAEHRPAEGAERREEEPALPS